MTKDQLITEDQRTFLRLVVIEQVKYQEIERVMNVKRPQLTKQWEELKEPREELSKIRKIWRKKCSEKIGFWDFHKWYSETGKKCHYCDITEPQIKSLIESGQINTKRLPTRGRSLEIERREPNESYDNTENLVFSCYWCNNAKSDEFTEGEFQAIGRRIREIWKQRLKTV